MSSSFDRRSNYHLHVKSLGKARRLNSSLSKLVSAGREANPLLSSVKIDRGKLEEIRKRAWPKRPQMKTSYGQRKSENYARID
jgi:hypothetical protein